MSGLLSMSLLPAKKCVLGRTAFLTISVPLPACREGLDHDRVQALGHLIPPACSSSLHAGRARQRRARCALSSGCKLAEYGVWEGHQVLRVSWESCHIALAKFR